MPHGRLLLMLVVLTATLAPGRPAATPRVATGNPAWRQRSGGGAGVSAVVRVALLQRIPFRQPDCRPQIVGDQSTGSIKPAAVPGPLLTRLPPPSV